jgi:predicted DsbA family dithiol-disulfide isomerase
MTAKLKAVANSLGLPFGDRTMTYNSRLAQELGKWAEAQGKGDEFHHAVFRVYLAEGKNIGKIPILIEVAESVDLDGKEALKIIQDRTFRQAVDLDWTRTYELKITAAPTFVINHEVLVGAQNYEALEMLLRSHHVTKKRPKV